MAELRALLERLRAVTGGMPKVALPAEPAPGRPGLGDDPETLIASVETRLTALRGAGDAAPALVRVADAAAALAALREAVAGVGRDQLLLPGDACERRDYAVGITPAVGVIAETGSMLLDVPGLADAWASLAVATHWVCACAGDLHADLTGFYGSLAGRIGSELGRVQVQVTGASRTADVEKIVVVPAHGPTRCVLLLADVPVDWAALWHDVGAAAS